MHHLKQPVPTALPTLNPTKPKRVVELVVDLVVEEALTDDEQTLTCDGIKTVTAEEMEVEERYITCSIEEKQVRRLRRLLAVSYAIAIRISIPETDPPYQKSEVEALSQTIGKLPELENLGASAEILSFQEEDQEPVSLATPPEEETSFPWLIVIIVFLVIGLGVAGMLLRRRQSAVVLGEK